ncbi:MAG TPA: hypothetical protein VGP23_14845 [Candidatus Binataceae bacterium]|jgi:hypothetical protein|nr:hypothetical protein [Candidatus Binataceae bacterium]
MQIDPARVSSRRRRGEGESRCLKRGTAFVAHAARVAALRPEAGL